MTDEFIFAPDEAGCGNGKHRAMIEVVTFVEVPDAHFATYVDGTIEQVVSKVKDMKQSAAPSASLYVSWCCKQCEEGSNG